MARRYFRRNSATKDEIAMARKVLIFGNGIGMAHNPDHFSLSMALESIWNEPRYISEDHKQMISRCIGTNGEPPEGEDKLDKLHMVVSSCKMINSLQDAQAQWLTPHGQQFPREVSRYIHKVATRLHIYDDPLPEQFLDSLFTFLRETNSHVATLNYDRLIYGQLVDNGLCAGYDGNLIDGFWGSGFNADNLVRRQGRNFGYYLHLHGSPLFYTDQNGAVCKLTRDNLSILTDVQDNHIVLTHVKHKRSVIDGSYILRTYWSYLHSCCLEAEEIVVFGYSGADTHLNDVLAAYAQSTPIRVIEWEGAGSDAIRRFFWSRAFRSDNVRVVPLENILQFTGW